VSLQTHVGDVVEVIAAGGLSDVVLVGHSYGGMVITAVAEQIAACLAHLVYLDAFLPEDGKALADYLPPGMIEQMAALAREKGDGWRIPMPFTPESLGLTRPDQAAAAFARMTDQPLQPALDRVSLRSAAAAALPRTFVYCTAPALGFFDDAAMRVRARGWNYRELQAGHACQLTAPEAVAAVLLEAAQARLPAGA
jgi:pimeloyl-ACP methyl ester carboxylesterase